jgi:hypothetical protein
VHRIRPAGVKREEIPEAGERLRDTIIQEEER